MTSTADSDAGGPIIAGSSNSVASSDLHGCSDDDFLVSHLFDFSNSPDALQTLEQFGHSDQKSFVDRSELSDRQTTPDSPTNSIHYLSSDSCSSTKRSHGSESSSSQTMLRDTTNLDDGVVMTDWVFSEADPFQGQEFQDLEFPYGRIDRDLAPLGADTPLCGHDAQVETFMEQSFDFKGACESPAQPSAPTGMPSPGMPAIASQGPAQPDQPFAMTSAAGLGMRIPKYLPASKRSSRKREASCEPSPMSAVVPYHGSSSPSATFCTPPPFAGADWSTLNGVNGWASKLNINSPTAQAAASAAAQFAAMEAQRQPRIPQHVPLPNSCPAYHFPGRCRLKIIKTPEKSRVETQIPIKMRLDPVPLGVTKLHLPPHTISKPKLMAKPTPDRSPDTLELFVSLVCTSAMNQPELKKKALERAARTPRGYLPAIGDEKNSPQNGGEVRICPGCITRERKRAARKKVKKPDEDKLWSRDEERRVVVFNTQEVKEWQPPSDDRYSDDETDAAQSSQAMQIDAPMRIACYCRHQSEKMGFNVIFTIKDWKDRVIAQAMSKPIMITDDHKTQQAEHPPPQQTAQQTEPDAGSAAAGSAHHLPTVDAGNALPATSVGSLSFSPPAAMQMNVQQAAFSAATSTKTTPTMSLATSPGRSLSRPPSPSLNGGHLAKKRKSSASRVPDELAMTPLDTSPTPASRGAASAQVSTTTSPFTPNLNPFAQDLPIGQQQQHNHPMSFTDGSPSPNGNEAPLFTNSRSQSIDNVNMAHLFLAPASAHPSRPPSPSGLPNGNGMNGVNGINGVSGINGANCVNGMNGIHGMNGMNVVNGVNGGLQRRPTHSLTSSSMFSAPAIVNSSRPFPIIHKIIPNEGPTVGGIEVTVLGASFFQGLEVWFGNQKATTTTFWGESSLVCLLPPSPAPGVVPVTFGRQGLASSHLSRPQPPLFRYVEDTEDRLIRNALAVIGQRWAGNNALDAGSVARIILNDHSNWSNGGSGGSGANGGAATNHASGAHLESQLLKVLDIIDLDESAHRIRLDLGRSTGHTMLHLACSLGYHRLVAALLARGANTDAPDRGGFTPLHMAAIHSHPEIVRRLLAAGADATIRSLSGLTAKDVCQSRAVERSIRSSRRHARSRSGGSLLSRTNSATSMVSAWEPLTRVHTDEGPLSLDLGEESPEYTSDDFEDSSADDDDGGGDGDDGLLSMRHPSRLRLDGEEAAAGSEELGNGMASNTAAMAAAIKDQIQAQFQQLHQTMALHLQNLASIPQVGMPQMPTFSGMPVFPDYQAYLPQAQFMRRVQQLVPGMSGNRGEGRGGGGEGEPKLDSRWWDISSYSKHNASAPPPAYEEIYPREDMDTKVQSALRAAADADADAKCASVMDEASSSKAKTEIPRVLEIGRKNAITKEQQDNFLRARDQKLKGLSNDRNLFFIWIPLLLAMVCALLYSYFPGLFPFMWTSLRAVVQTGIPRVLRDRAVEV